MKGNEILVALGGNLPGRWGQPNAAIGRALREMQSHGVEIVACSHLYLTPAVGGGRAAPYVNAVARVRTRRAPLDLLHLFKALERQAGRRTRPMWAPRPLDLDILDYRGVQLGQGTGWRRDGLTLPHPRLHERGFVLVPLAEVAPGWRHRRLGLTARALLARAPWLRRGIRLA